MDHVTYVTEGGEAICFTWYQHQQSTETLDISPDHPIGSYKMESEPRGEMLIINNEHFQNEVQSRRYGSLEDVNNLEQLFNRLRFNVTVKNDLGHIDMRQEILRFTERIELNHVDMCTVAIMSHGIENSVLTTDGRSVECEWILEQFNNRHCPQLRGKPKLFIFQCCRGDEEDHGVMSNNNRGSFQSPVESEVRPLTPATRQSIGSKDASWEDILVAYATIPGMVAYRNNMTGSWFIKCLCKVFDENAERLDIRDMLDIVTEKMKEFQSEEGSKQSCEIVNRGFNKKLYFNP